MATREKSKNIPVTSIIQYLRNRELGVGNSPAATANVESYIWNTETDRLELALCPSCIFGARNRQVCSIRMQSIHHHIHWMLYLRRIIDADSDSDTDSN
jgi:hypothetical protein